MNTGQKARYPSLGYSNLYFVVVEENDDTDMGVAIDVASGNIWHHIPGATIRGNIIPAVGGMVIIVQRDHPDPPPIPPGVDDFFVCRTTAGVLNWWLNTPGVTQPGAYPVIDNYGDMYVQGPDGLYQVSF
jgi:hypothetical protein